MSTATAVKPSLTIKRRLNASPAKVFAAWTDPQKMIRWMGPPSIIRCEVENDLRVGGHLAAAEHRGAGHVRDVEPFQPVLAGVLPSNLTHLRIG